MTGSQWETIEEVKGDSDMLINVELESDLHESGLAGNVVTAGDNDELDTGSCLKELDDMEIVDPGEEWGGVRYGVEFFSGSATSESV